MKTPHTITSENLENSIELLRWSSSRNYIERIILVEIGNEYSILQQKKRDSINDNWSTREVVDCGSDVDILNLEQ